MGRSAEPSPPLSKSALPVSGGAGGEGVVLLNSLSGSALPDSAGINAGKRSESAAGSPSPAGSFCGPAFGPETSFTASILFGAASWDGCGSAPAEDPAPAKSPASELEPITAAEGESVCAADGDTVVGPVPETISTHAPFSGCGFEPSVAGAAGAVGSEARATRFSAHTGGSGRPGWVESDL